VDMTGTVAGAVMSLRGSAPDDLRLTLDSDDMALEARLAWNEERKALIDGVTGGRPVTGWLDRSGDRRTGSSSLDARGARVEAALSTAPPGPRTAQMQRNVGGSATVFEEPSDEQTPWVDLYASGTVTPTVQLEGKVHFVPLEERAAF